MSVVHSFYTLLVVSLPMSVGVILGRGRACFIFLLHYLFLGVFLKSFPQRSLSPDLATGTSCSDPLCTIGRVASFPMMFEDASIFRCRVSGKVRTRLRFGVSMFLRIDGLFIIMFISLGAAFSIELMNCFQSGRSWRRRGRHNIINLHHPINSGPRCRHSLVAPASPTKQGRPIPCLRTLHHLKLRRCRSPFPLLDAVGYRPPFAQHSPSRVHGQDDRTAGNDAPFQPQDGPPTPRLVFARAEVHGRDAKGLENQAPCSSEGCA